MSFALLAWGHLEALDTLSSATGSKQVQTGDL